MSPCKQADSRRERRRVASSGSEWFTMRHLLRGPPSSGIRSLASSRIIQSAGLAPLNLAATLGSRLLVVYDGYCGLCNRTVRWLLARDRRDRLRFAPSSSPAVAALLTRHGFTPDASPNGPFPSGPGTILVVRNPGSTSEQVLIRSSAVAALLATLPGPWPAAALALRLVPRPLRDLAYSIIARWRYHIWGRFAACPLFTPDEQARFL